MLDRSTVDELVADADVVVHLAFIIFGDREETRNVNLEGTRNVFEACVAAGTRRLVYTSSIAAYGFHPDTPEVVTEDDMPRGTEEFYYSAQKAELEALFHELRRRLRHRGVHLPAEHRRGTRRAGANQRRRQALPDRRAPATGTRSHPGHPGCISGDTGGRDVVSARTPRRLRRRPPRCGRGPRSPGHL